MRGNHGLTAGRRIPPLYRTWSNIKIRCYLESHKDYPIYGGRGIIVCDRWLDGDGNISGFECFSADMGPKPSPTHSVERIDNDLGYTPENCRWSTPKEQARNNRHNRVVSIDGHEMLIGDAIRRHAVVSEGQVYQRLRAGWSIEDALKTPKRRRPIHKREF